MIVPRHEDIRASMLDMLPGHEAFLTRHIFEPFMIPEDVLKKVRDLLDTNISDALDPVRRHQSPLGIEPSFVTHFADGSETGTCLALDLGGTNLRVLKVVYKQKQEPEKEMVSKHVPEEILTGSAIQLFDFIADELYTFMEAHNLLDAAKLTLGFTFSFPVNQTSLTVACLTKWTKDFDCKDAIGQDVGKMLKDALKRKGIKDVECVAIMNDTVATLVAGTLHDHTCSIGLICGTGTNACYLEQMQNLRHMKLDYKTSRYEKMAIDTRWNDFGDDGETDFLRTEYDLQLNTHSLHPRDMLFEKLMCGMDIGELVRLVLVKLHKADVGILSKWLNEPESEGKLHSKDVSDVIRDTGRDTEQQVLKQIGVEDPSIDDCKILYNVCQLVTLRAANLIAACTSCLVNRVNLPQVGIAVDGSFFKGNPVLQDLIVNSMKYLVKPSIKFHFVPCDDGSSMGAATIAALMKREG